MTKCKKCLLNEIVGKEDVYKKVQELKRLLSPEEKVSQEEYDRRLGICKECDRLLEATCQKCGCYVEIRALKTDSHCPAKNW